MCSSCRNVGQNAHVVCFYSVFSKARVFEIMTLLMPVKSALSWRRSLSYRSQSIDLVCKSMDWFLYDRNLHERVNGTSSMKELMHNVPKWSDAL